MRVVIYGGNGFVGTKVAESLQRADHSVSCVSRSGVMPKHLEGDLWAQNVKWLKGDAFKAEKETLAEHDVLISTVGAPPLPTITKAAFERSLHTNGVVNQALIQRAGEIGIKRVILLSAKLMPFMQGDWFAYAKGKAMSAAAAQSFAALSNEHSSVVIKPGVIYGKRHTRSGREIPLDLAMKPLAKLLPSQFVSVDQVAQCISDAAAGLRATQDSFTVIEHQQI